MVSSVPHPPLALLLLFLLSITQLTIYYSRPATNFCFSYRFFIPIHVRRALDLLSATALAHGPPSWSFGVNIPGIRAYYFLPYHCATLASSASTMDLCRRTPGWRRILRRYCILPSSLCSTWSFLRKGRSMEAILALSLPAVSFWFDPWILSLATEI